MLNNQGAESKHSGIVELDGITGVKGNIYTVHIESRVRFESVGVGVTNVVACEGSIRGSSTWTTLGSILGIGQATADVSTFDFIRFNVITADGLGICISSGFISMF